jgi:hypothetical protein
MTTKEEFLTEHNRLSSHDLQATLEQILRFYDEKRILFKDEDWSLEKIRRPFILWLTSMPDREGLHRKSSSGWITFPRPADS